MLSRERLLAEVPLFSALDADERCEIEARLRERRYSTGEAICRAGDPGDSLFIVESGELTIRAGDPQLVVSIAGRGRIVGEMALLFGGTRTATVIASRDAVLLELTDVDFRALWKKDARILEAVTHIVCANLAARNRDEVPVRPTRIVAVIAQRIGAGASTVAAALATDLTRFGGGPVLYVESGGRDPVGSHSAAGPRDMPGGFARLSIDSPADSASLAALRHRYGSTFPWIVLDVPGDVARAEADVIVAVGAGSVVAGDARPHLSVINLHAPGARCRAISNCAPYVLPVSSALSGPDPFEAARRLVQRDADPAGPPLRRLARKLLGRTVGLAMGGGAAYGVANGGVVEALDAAGIEVDCVAGSSAGAFVALSYASGRPVEDLRDAALDTMRMRALATTASPALSGPGLIDGRRLARRLGQMMGGVETFDTLQRPARVVACDVESGERIAIGDGDVLRAAQASSAIPMVMTPVSIGHRVLVDGGTVDPVPAEVVREMGADVVIAVNVVPRPRKGVENVVTRSLRHINRLNPLSWVGERQTTLSRFDIVMNSFQVLQHELGHFKSISADVRINPELAEFTWIDFHRGVELMARGREATERALPVIRRVLEARRPIA